jgi:nucleoside phosphorylase
MNSYPSIAVITAIPKEAAAVEMALQKPISVDYIEDSKIKVTLGILSTVNGIKHYIALCCLPKYANNMSAIVTTQLINKYPSIENFILVGIAGGVPNTRKPDKDVILGDVVFSEGAVASYLAGKIKGKEFITSESSPPPSVQLTNALRDMERFFISKPLHWLNHVTSYVMNRQVLRPSRMTGSKREPKKDDAFKNSPLIRFGRFGSGSAVMKSKVYRDYFAAKYGIMAFEMEGSGIADSACVHRVGYIVIKSICDYSDENKNDVWQEYCAHVATAALIYYLSFVPQADTLPQIYEEYSRHIDGPQQRCYNNDDSEHLITSC